MVRVVWLRVGVAGSGGVPGTQSSYPTASYGVGVGGGGASGDGVIQNNSASALVPSCKRRVGMWWWGVAGGSGGGAGADAVFDVVVRNVGGADVVGSVEVSLGRRDDVAGALTASGTGWSCSGSTCVVRVVWLRVGVAGSGGAPGNQSGVIRRRRMVSVSVAVAHPATG